MATFDSTLRALQEQFQAAFDAEQEVGASLSIWLGGAEVCSLHAGHRDRAKNQPWDQQTMAPVWSATKGPAAACVLLALHEKGLTPSTKIGEIWPELAQGTLKDRTVGLVLSHQAGLCAFDTPPPITDYAAVIEELENQMPLWAPGSDHGYHARTFGFLTDELVRRLAHQPIGDFWRDRFADPLQLDFWIGLPESEDHRVAEMIPARGPTDLSSQEFYRALGIQESLTRRTFSSPRGLDRVSDINLSDTWRLGLASMGGIGSASALAQFYALLAVGGVWEDIQLIPNEVCRWAEELRVSGEDAVLLTTTAFSNGFMKDPPALLLSEQRRKFGPSPRAFGHPGAGGSHAFADPSNHIGFAYVMNQMERSVFPTQKVLSLIQILYRS
ncbi:MAG: serine hydrolase domain-containing protein [Verrucomicrobiota bacterium]